MCDQARCQGRFCKSVSFLVSRNAYMPRDPCYGHLGLRWYLFKKIVKAFHIFSFKCFTPQDFDCGQAVVVNNKILRLEVNFYFRTNCHWLRLEWHPFLMKWTQVYKGKEEDKRHNTSKNIYLRQIKLTFVNSTSKTIRKTSLQYNYLSWSESKIRIWF